MKPTKQTVLHEPLNNRRGNCLSAVLASLLHIPIEDVPLFVTPETWVKDLNAWLRPFGLAYCLIEDFECQIDAYGIEGLWHEVSGNTTRNKEVKHSCVAKDGAFVFDPHPDDSGLTKVTRHGFFIALRPWQWPGKPLFIAEQEWAAVLRERKQEVQTTLKPLDAEQIDSLIQQHVDPVATYRGLHRFARESVAEFCRLNGIKEQA
jgi:hypothetical protein